MGKRETKQWNKWNCPQTDGLRAARRTFLRQALGLAGSAMVLLPSCRTSASSAPETTWQQGGPPAFDQAAGPVREFRRVAQVGEVEVAPGRLYRTWLYNGKFPGDEIRVREGERLRVTVENRLPEATTIHWHGVPVPNNMDGVPEITQPPILPNTTFTYEFLAGPSGTYMYHSHVGLQLDRGLLGALVIEERTPHVKWDREYTLVLDDFLPAEPRMPDPRRQGGMGRMGMMGMMGSASPGYAGLLVNGLLPSAAPVFEIRRGEQVRLRLINPSGATTFRVAITGHRMTVSHADGRPVEPVLVDSLIIGMGERYDVIVEANNPGVWTLAAASVDGQPAEPARAILRYAGFAASAPRTGETPEGLRGGRVLRLEDLVALELANTVDKPNRYVDLLLSGGMMSPAWTINGQAYPNADPLQVRQGERVRFRLTNHSMMLHPMHLHGHFFRVGRALKDTVMVPPHMAYVDLDFTADNPGRWLFHCHNLYHMEMGMMRVVEYA